MKLGSYAIGEPSCPAALGGSCARTVEIPSLFRCGSNDFERGVSCFPEARHVVSAKVAASDVDRLGSEPTKSRGARVMKIGRRPVWSMNLFGERQRAPESGMAEEDTTEGLSLYGYPQCPFCNRVLNAIEQLGLEIPLRNTMQDASYRTAVVEALGRGTVPVLRIDGDDGDIQWMPESVDIIRYLAGRFGA